MIDYERIIEELNDEKLKLIFEKLDIPYQEKEDYFLLPTVCHHDSVEEASWKLYCYKDTHLFVCYSEDGNMSIFKFLKNFYECRGIDYDWYEDIYKLILNASEAATHRNDERYKPIRNNYLPQTKRKELQIYSKNVLDTFVKYYPIEWLQEGITKETMDKFNIRFSISQNKIIIPHYDVNNNLIGIRGRALNTWEIETLGKYMPVCVEGKWYSHPLSLNLYGLNVNLENIKKEKICFIAEGEKSVLLAENFSRPNTTVAVCGSNLNKYVVKDLVKLASPKEIIICFDREEEDKSKKYFNKLYKMCSKYKNYANFSFVYDREGITKMKDSPYDCGEEIFEKLVKERVKL